jgi:hypothetical protein
MKSISRDYQNAWRRLPHVMRRKRLAQRLRRLWRRLYPPEGEGTTAAAQPPHADEPRADERQR